MELPTKRPSAARFLERVDPETGEVVKVQVHNEAGQELPDPVPMAPPLGYEKPLSMFDIQRAQIRAEHHRLRQAELDELAETPEEANDFGEDVDLEDQPSLYEEKFDPVDFEVRSRLRQAEYRARYEAAVDKLPPQQRELLSGDNLRREQQGTTEPARTAHRSSSSTGSNSEPEKHAGKEQEPRVSGDVREGSVS